LQAELLFWLRYQPNSSAAGRAYSAPLDPLAIIMRPTSKGRKGGEKEVEEGRQRERGGRGREGRGRRTTIEMMPTNHNPLQ